MCMTGVGDCWAAMVSTAPFAVATTTAGAARITAVVAIDAVTRRPPRPALLRSGFTQFGAQYLNAAGDPAPSLNPFACSSTAYSFREL